MINLVRHEKTSLKSICRKLFFKMIELIEKIVELPFIKIRKPTSTHHRGRYGQTGRNLCTGDHRSHRGIKSKGQGGS
jgi:hypothetical protein